MNYIKLSLLLLIGSRSFNLLADEGARALLRKTKDRVLKTVEKAGETVSEKSKEVGQSISDSARDVGRSVKREAQETWSDFQEAYQEVREAIAPNAAKRQNFLTTIENKRERAIAEYVLDGVERSGLLKDLVSQKGCFRKLSKWQLQALVSFYGVKALEKFDTREDVMLLDDELDALGKSACDRVYRYLRDELIQ